MIRVEQVIAFEDPFSVDVGGHSTLSESGTQLPLYRAPQADQIV